MTLCNINDIVVIIGNGNGNFLVLLDLSAAFDTIDHNNLFTVLEKHVGICDDALNLIVSYLNDQNNKCGLISCLTLPASYVAFQHGTYCTGPTKVLPLSLTTVFNFETS